MRRKAFINLITNQGSVEINTTCPAITPSLGAELLTNNTFETDTVWNKGAGWTIADGVGVGTNAQSLLRQILITTAGNWYQVVWDLVSLTGGGVQGFPGVAGAVTTALGTHTTTARATGTNAGVNGIGGSGFSGTVDNIYCKQITFASMLSLLGDILRKNGTYICHPTVAVDSQCGMVIEYVDENNYVLANVDRGTGKAMLSSKIAGATAAVINTAITYSAGAELKVVVNGTNHALYYNDAQVGTTQSIDNSGMGTNVYGFNSLAGNEVGLVTTSPFFDPFLLAAPTDADFSIVVLPDTQEYVTADPTTILTAMSNYIVAKETLLKIGLCIHVGDQVGTEGNDTQWTRAEAMKTALDGAGIPFFVVPGNHDYDQAIIPEARPLTDFNARFSAQGTARYEADHGENAYLNLTLGTQDYIVLGMEFGPRQAVIDWANTTLAANPTRRAIIVTHAYMYTDGTRIGTGDLYNPKTLVDSADVHDGDELWTELVKLNANSHIVLSGHENGFLYRQDLGDSANKITQILMAHFSGSSGDLLVMEFYLSTNSVRLTCYSPYTGVTRSQQTVVLA